MDERELNAHDACGKWELKASGWLMDQVLMMSVLVKKGIVRAHS